MKRLCCLMACLVVLLLAGGCRSDSPAVTLHTGQYNMVGEPSAFLFPSETDGEHLQAASVLADEGFVESDDAFFQPTLTLNLDDSSFVLSLSPFISYAEVGNFELKGNRLIATSQEGVYSFEVKDSETLVLISTEGNVWFKPTDNASFVYDPRVE